jgi:hypothetical protein
MVPVSGGFPKILASTAGMSFQQYSGAERYGKSELAERGFDGIEGQCMDLRPRFETPKARDFIGLGTRLKTYPF